MIFENRTEVKELFTEIRQLFSELEETIIGLVMAKYTAEWAVDEVIHEQEMQGKASLYKVKLTSVNFRIKD